MASTHTGIVHQRRGQTTIEYLPLEEVKVRAWVVDVSSRIVLTQKFHNPSDEPTGRAKYVFPLPANAAVCAFELKLEDGSIIIGEVKEKEEAAHTFSRAVEQGRTAALVEVVTDDIFTLSVGSIPATTRVTTHLTFVMDLLDEALRDHVRLQLPMYIAERYGAQPAAMDDALAVGSRTRLEIRVDVQTSDVIHDIRSPTHRVKLQRYKGHSGPKSQRRMSAIWKSSEFLNSDFVLTVHAEGLDKPRGFAEVLYPTEGGSREGSTVAIQLTLVPKFFAPKVPSQEYIFIIDRSGSMQGVPIETAKETLTMLLRLLPTMQTMFNIFSFGSKVTSLWKKSRALDPSSLAEATAHVASMSANYGGTETPSALKAAFGSRGLDRPAAVFLLTDGAIYANSTLDPFDVVSVAIRNSPPHAPIRLFVLGIGDGVSSDICSKLARQGNGECLFARSTGDIWGKCARLLNAGRSTNINRINIDWGHGPGTASPVAVSLPSTTTPSLPAGLPALEPPPPIQQAPHLLTKIFSGMRFTVFAITSFNTVPAFVRLTVELEGVSEPQEWVVSVTKVKPFRDTDEHSDVPILHTLAARRLITDLDDGVGLLPTPASPDALLVSKDDLQKAGIVRLGLTYQLVSKHTSFVAVQNGGEQRRDRGRRRGGVAWVRSRLRQADLDGQEDNSRAETLTFLDGVIDGVSSFITSVFGFLSKPATLASVANTRLKTRSHHRPEFPGAFNESDSNTDGSRGHRSRHTSSSLLRRQSPSPHSVVTFSTLSSLESSSYSSRWTSSRSPSPLPRFRGPMERAPSPSFLRGTSVPVPRPTNPGTGHGGLNAGNRVPIPQEVYDLFQQMGVDGSMTSTPLLTRLVGDAVLGKADELGVDRKVWATVVAVAYIQMQLEGEPDLLDLMEAKAREFVDASEWARRGGARQFDDMVREAVALLSSRPSGP